MRSTIDIDEKLLEEAKKLTRARTKKELIRISLQELVRKKRREHLAGLFGSEIIDTTVEDIEKWREGES
jgi:Arc/MetJ family transcription regulator